VPSPMGERRSAFFHQQLATGNAVLFHSKFIAV